MTTTRRRKHPCPDCRQCQHCSETRCHLCRGQGAKAGQLRFAGLSMAQQIALYEALNRGQAPPEHCSCRQATPGQHPPAVICRPFASS